MSVTNNSPSQDFSHPDDLFQSRYVTPGFKPFSYKKVSSIHEIHVCKKSHKKKIMYEKKLISNKNFMTSCCHKWQNTKKVSMNSITCVSLQLFSFSFQLALIEICLLHTKIQWKILRYYKLTIEECVSFATMKRKEKNKGRVMLLSVMNF